MSIASSLTIAQMNPDGSVPVPADPNAVVDKAVQAAQMEQRVEALQERLDALQEVLNKPLSEILADHEKAQETALAWDRYGAMWMLAQRAMRRVALDLAAQQGLDEQEVVARALAHANAVLNGDGEDLGGSIAPAQMAHIARHRAHLRKQFR
ncbi:hypothetical protein [Paracidovorax wautersii]|uniref:Cell division septum initiation protein DivIVA n=1 Tax=Paracidovorax wautersii TaxID=1177982 RepID=A0ABU1I758_9BURK|nr:hypothetical protein [Paracidovorax wautersii]MDR6212900.1 cell division septum initiation protein DivIVA [Paracidovorax wautersii]